MKIYITGTAGTGKTTIAENLKEKGYESFSIDEVPGLCYWANRSTGEKVNYDAKLDKEFIDSHAWICDIQKLTNMIRSKENIFVTGISENQNDFFQLFDKIILLQCKPEIFIERILKRKNNDFGKDKGAQQYLLSTYEGFEKDTIEKGASPLDVDRPINEVVADVIALS